MTASGPDTCSCRRLGYGAPLVGVRERSVLPHNYTPGAGAGASARKHAGTISAAGRNARSDLS
jgi:hypothetical protein